MDVPKLHHYVPQFYLRRFVDPGGRLWVWDREKDRVFPTAPKSIAAETNFYFLSDLAEQGYDPLTMEKQFSDLEGDTSIITGQWIDWVRHGKPGDSLPIPDVNREIVSLFIALQFLRTADTRSILASFSSSAESDDEKRTLHVKMLWDEQLFTSLSEHIRHCTWIFAYNDTATPFITSDNPVAFRTLDNQMWLKVGFLGDQAYVVYPLAPDVMMYCYPDNAWDRKISRFDRQISPVVFTDSMVWSDNSAQVFMASRFVISVRASFDTEREFAKTIGTDILRDQRPSA